MIEGSMYELDVHRTDDETWFTLTNLRERVSKHFSDSMDIIRHAFMVASGDLNTNTVLFDDITNLFFMLRTRIREMAQSVIRNLIEVFGLVMLYKWKHIYLSRFSYTVIHPEMSVERSARNMLMYGIRTIQHDEIYVHAHIRNAE